MHHRRKQLAFTRRGLNGSSSLLTPMPTLKRYHGNEDKLNKTCLCGAADLWVNTAPVIIRPNAGLMLGQRLRRWPNINPAFGQSLVIYVQTLTQ